MSELGNGGTQYSSFLLNELSFSEIVHFSCVAWLILWLFEFGHSSWIMEGYASEWFVLKDIVFVIFSHYVFVQKLTFW